MPRLPIAALLALALCGAAPALAEGASSARPSVRPSVRRSVRDTVRRSGRGAGQDARPRGGGLDPVRKIRPAQRAGSHPDREPPAAGGRRQPVVSRRPGRRGAGPDRLRAPVRTHDVRRHPPPAARHGGPAAGGRRRDRLERQHRFRPHQLLRHGAVQPAGALGPRRPDGLPARRARPARAVEPAGGGAQRAPPDHRKPARRDRRGGAIPPVVPARPSVLRRHPVGPAGRRARLLRPLLRPHQRQLGDRRRHRSGAGAAAGGALFRPPAGRAGAAEGAGGHAAHRGRAARSGGRQGRPAARLHGLAEHARLPARRRRTEPGGADPRRRQVEPALPVAGVPAPDRPGRQREPEFAGAQLGVLHQRDGPAARRRKSRRPSTKSWRRCGATGRAGRKCCAHATAW